MIYSTGSTIYQQVVSVDGSNAPVSGATFDTVLFHDNAASALSVSVAAVDDARGIYMASFVPMTFGQYQLYMRNNVTTTIFTSEPYVVSADTQSSPIEVFVGI